MSYRFHHLPSRGFSTIEQALVLPVIIMLVLGMIDITNVLRAKYTADEGVRSALRCAIATDSACGISTASTPKSERYFRVDLLPANEEQVPVVDIEANVEYLTVQPEVYAPVVREPPTERFLFSRVTTRYEATATVPYVVESLPYVRFAATQEDYDLSGSRIDESGKVVPTNTAPRTRRLMGRETIHSRGGKEEIKKFSFKGLESSLLPLSPDKALLPCARDVDLSEKAEPARCRATSDSIPGFIHIKANSPTLEGDEDRDYGAQAELSITFEGKKRDSLGGQHFRQRIKGPTNKTYPRSDPVNFVPRGAQLTHVAKTAKGARKEFKVHQALEFPIGADFTIELKVFPSDGVELPVDVEIESIEVVLPDYIEREEKVACKEPIDECQLREKQCEFDSAFGGNARATALAEGRVIKEEESLGCHQSSDLAQHHSTQGSCKEGAQLLKGESCGVYPRTERLWSSVKLTFAPEQCSEQPSFSKPLPSGTELVRLERLPSDEKPERVASATQKELKELKEGTSDKYRCDRFERKETKLLDLPDLNWKKPYLILLTRCSNDPSSVLPTLPEGVYYTNASLVRTGEFRAPLPGVTLPSCVDKRIAPSAGPVTPLGEFKEGEFPEICKTQSCLSSVTRIVTLSDHAAYLPDLKMAEKVGVESMEGLFGQLQDDKSSYRGSVSTKYLTKTGAPPKADLSDAQAVEVTTTVTVPSLLSIPGSGSTYSVSSSRTQRIEKSFIR